MFFLNKIFSYRYAPILSVSPSEMSAIEQLPEKDKDLILPIFPLKGWVSSNKLENTLKRIKQAIGDRYWIANVDEAFLTDNKEFLLTGKYPSRDVFIEIQQLLNPNNGFDNWCRFIADNPKAIPSVLWGSTVEISRQIEKLSLLNRGIVIHISPKTNQAQLQEAFRYISERQINDIFVLVDLGQVTSSVVNDIQRISNYLRSIHKIVKAGLFAFSASSFPSGFSGYNHGENSIYERIAFNKVREVCADLPLIYSDRGSARADKINGGGGIPSPRIDYPLKNDWRFIREEYQDSSNPLDGEKETLYAKIAKELMGQDYWVPHLKLWGTQLIELTALKDKYGINSPAKATAARINIHLHIQLHYDKQADVQDTDDDWND